MARLLIIGIVAVLACGEIQAQSAAQTALDLLNDQLENSELATTKLQLKNAQDSLNLQVRLHAQKEKILKDGLKDQFNTIKSLEGDVSNLKNNLTDSESEVKRLLQLLVDLEIAHNATKTQLLNKEQQLKDTEDALVLCQSNLRQEEAVKTQVQGERDICIADLARCTRGLTSCVGDYNITSNSSDHLLLQLTDCLVNVDDKDSAIKVLNETIARTQVSLDRCRQGSLICEKNLSTRDEELANCRNSTEACNQKVDDLIKDLGIAKGIEVSHIQCKGELQKLQDKLIKTTALKNCAAWKAENVPSGEYLVDPDGPGNGLAPFKVVCHFENGQVETHVKHDTPAQFVSKADSKQCEFLKSYGIDKTPYDDDDDSSGDKHRKKGGKRRGKRSGSNEKKYGNSAWAHSKWQRGNASPRDIGDGAAFCQGQTYTYGLNADQINALKADSKACSQKVSWDCYDQSALTVFAESGKRHKGKSINNYYSYSPAGQLECACAADSTCLNDKGCNCFTDDTNWHHDDIEITEPEALPVVRIGLGDLNDKNEQGKFMLGHLICVNAALI